MDTVGSVDFRGVMSLLGGQKPFLVRGFDSNKSRQMGFTLIELMITLGVASILMTIAVPSFQELITSNRLSTEVNGFIGALHMARSEAIKTSNRVGLCASTTGTSCAGSGGWEQGYMVYRDTNRNSTFDSGEFIVRTGAPMRGNITLRSSVSSTARSLTFASSGRITSFTGVSFQIVACDDRSKSFASNVRSKARVITVNTVGSTRALKGDEAGVTVTSCTPS